jgi:hypothetical protein
MDRDRRRQVRRADDADHHTQNSQGGAPSRNNPALNTNSNFNIIRKGCAMKASDVFKSKYLKSSDVKTKQQIATISCLEIEAVGQDKKEKPVLYFEGDVLPMVVNKTNFLELEEAFGDSDEWPGHKVKIFCARTTYQGKKTDGIRVEAIIPKPALEDDLNDKITA